MNEFPRTDVGGVSLPRLIIGTNWFLGYSHKSVAKDRWITSYQTRERIADVLCTFLEYGVDAMMGMPEQIITDAINDAQDRMGRGITLLLTPGFNIQPGGNPEDEPGRVFDACKKLGATFCMPHMSVTDTLLDKMTGRIRDMEKYVKMIRDREMVPGLSTHMPETIGVVDKTGLDVTTYIQPYNSMGFLMQVEVDWVMRIIENAKKPVMTFKPLAAGRMTPPVAFPFVWNSIRDCDMMIVGTATADEAKEVVEVSLALLERRLPDHELQRTRSKKSLEA